MDKPTVVKSHDIHLDTEYASWIHEVKERYRNTQIKAAVKVNSEQLLFNWMLGRDLVTRKAEEKWGTGIVEQVSLDLQNEFPNTKGFSTTNLWYMKQWYSFYASDLEKLQQLVGEIDKEVFSSSIRLNIAGILIEYNPECLTKHSGYFLSFTGRGYYLKRMFPCRIINAAYF